MGLKLCLWGPVFVLGLSLNSASAISIGANHAGGIRAKACLSTSKLSLKSSNKLTDYSYLCYGLHKESGKTFYCDAAQKDMDCGSVKLRKSSEKWQKLAEKSSNLKDKKIFNGLKSSSNSKSLLLASSVDLMKLKKPVSTGANLRLVTGHYSRLVLNKNPLKLKCLDEVLFAGQVLQREFQEFNFEIDGRINNCKNLKDGVALLLKNKKQVVKNLKHIHSPMHTIYLSTQTKFNNDTLGEMGLYVNVNKANEIKNRLVDFTISGEMRRGGMPDFK